MTAASTPGSDSSAPSGSEEEIPNPTTGVGIGAGEEGTFEPEEDPEAVPEADADGPVG